jgi:hypothetical protein
MRPTRLDLIINPGGGQLSATEHLGDSSSDFADGIPQHRGDTAEIVVTEDEGRAADLISAAPADCEAGVRLLDVDRPWVARLGDARRQLLGGIEIQASPLSVENRSSGPIVTTRLSRSAARR